MTLTADFTWWEHHNGDHENPPNSNHVDVWDDYHRITGAPDFQGQPWCGAALTTALWTGNFHNPTDWIGVLNIEAWAKAHGRWSYGPNGVVTGDALVLLGAGVHCGQARGDYARGEVPTWEGNTSTTASGSQFDGGGIAAKIRSASQVYGRCRIHDLLGGGHVPGGGGTPTPQFRKERAHGELKLWETGPRVEQMQRRLAIVSDGYYGRSTARAVHAFKVHRGWPNHDGNVAGAPLLVRLHNQPSTDKHPTLTEGALGGSVRTLQRRLNDHKPAKARKVAVDSSYGEDTARLIVTVKEHLSMPNHDGRIAGQELWKRLAA